MAVKKPPGQAGREIPQAHLRLRGLMEALAQALLALLKIPVAVGVAQLESVRQAAVLLTILGEMVAQALRLLYQAHL